MNISDYDRQEDSHEQSRERLEEKGSATIFNFNLLLLQIIDSVKEKIEPCKFEIPEYFRCA